MIWQNNLRESKLEYTLKESINFWASIGAKMSKRKRAFLLADVIVLIVLVALDQVTKYWAILKLKNQPAIPIISGVFELKYLENRGAAFGVLQNQKVFFLIMSVIILCGVVFVLYKVPDEKKYNLLHIIAVMIAGGGIGNMIDRLRFDYVVDFLSFVLINFPIFNVADMYVTISMAILVVLVLFVYKEEDFSFLTLKRKKISGDK